LSGREEALRVYQEERRKRREKEDLERERLRDGIRQKYGIARKADSFEKNLQVRPMLLFFILSPKNSAKK
jgi:hypothetical protein